VKRIKRAEAAINYLDINTPKVILVTDEALIYAQNRPVLEKLKSYIRNGGRAVFCLDFPIHTPRDPFNSFFDREFGVSWQRCMFGLANYGFNAGCILPADSTAASFRSQTYMKAVTVMGAQSWEEIYKPIYAPDSMDDVQQAAVAGARIGEGYLIYFGDVNADVANTRDDRILLSLCGF